MDNLQESIIEAIMSDPKLIEKINKLFEKNVADGEYYLVYNDKSWYFGRMFYNTFIQKYDLHAVWQSYGQILDYAEMVFKINLP